MYEQLSEAVKIFQTEENVKECLHQFDTQQNEALNMAVSKYVPKYKHFGTTMALDTRIRCVIGTHNLGYKGFYFALLKNLGCLDNNSFSKKRLILSGIARIDETRNQNKIIKSQPATKRRRKFGLLAKTKRQIYEERVDRATKMGTYKTSAAIICNEEELLQTKSSKKKEAQNKCSKCGKTGHKTWRSRKCFFHDDYIMEKALPSNTRKKKKHTHTHDLPETSIVVADRSGLIDEGSKSKLDEKNKNNDTGSENELCGTASDNRNIIPVPKNTITEDVGDTMVCSPVGNLPIRTPVPVHEQINNFMTPSTGTSTGIEYTTVPKTDNYDSILEEDMIVESPVEFFVTWNMITTVFQIIFQKVPSKLMISG